MGPRAAGVILVLTAKYASGWIDITADTDGRAIGAIVALRDDSQVRVIVACGVSGACCPNFLHSPPRSKPKQDSMDISQLR